jgi:hypothetical protein
MHTATRGPGATSPIAASSLLNPALSSPICIVMGRPAGSATPPPRRSSAGSPLRPEQRMTGALLGGQLKSC